MAIVVSAVLLVAAVLVYVRQLREAWWLLGLRLLVICLLAMILGDAAIRRFWTVQPKRVAVLVDVSASMAAGGVDSVAWSAAAAFPVPDGLSKEYWSFSDSLRRGSRGDELEFPTDSAGTLIGSALQELIDTEPGAVVLVSDGRDNGDLDPVMVARAAGVAVYTVGCGRQEMRNVEAARLVVPAEVYAGDTALLRVRLRYAGIKGEEVAVRVAGGVKRVVLRDEVAEQELLFRHVFREPGRRVVRMTVDSLPGEDTYVDNERVAVVDVRPARVRVLYVTNRPGIRTRFLTRALAADPRVELDRQVILQGGPVVPKDRIAAADVVVIDGVVEAGGEPGLSAAVHSAARQGTGVLVLAGPDMKVGSGLERLLPGGKGVLRRSGEFKPVLSGAARVLSWLSDISLQELPPFDAVFEPVEPGGYEHWLVSSDSGVPLVGAYRVGRGRVVFVGVPSLWRWGFGTGRDRGTPLELFLGGVVRYLAGGPGLPFVLTTDRSGYFRGERVRFTLAARTPDGAGWDGLDAFVVSSVGDTMPMVDLGGGTYEAELPNAVPGEHRVEAVVRLGDSVVGRVGSTFAVADRSVELSLIGLDSRLLEAVAARAGGAYFSCDSLPGVGFEPELAVYRRGFDFSPRRTPWVYLLVAVLAAFEWLLRRRKGML